MKINNMTEMCIYLDTINNIDDMRYDDCKMHSFSNVEGYESMLDVVLNLKDKPKRVVDIGSNLNQYAYLFENVGIQYIGIDLWNATHYMKPYINENVKFIGAKYEDISEWFEDDVIISQLCVGYLVNIEDVKAKHFICTEIVDGKWKGVLKW